MNIQSLSILFCVRTLSFIFVVENEIFINFLETFRKIINIKNKKNYERIFRYYYCIDSSIFCC
jgi:hypothetical protein